MATVKHGALLTFQQVKSEFQVSGTRLAEAARDHEFTWEQGPGRYKLVDRAELERWLAACRCPGCGEPTERGNKWHRGCYGERIITGVNKRHDEAFRQRLDELGRFDSATTASHVGISQVYVIALAQEHEIGISENGPWSGKRWMFSSADWVSLRKLVPPRPMGAVHVCEQCGDPLPVGSDRRRKRCDKCAGRRRDRLLAKAHKGHESAWAEYKREHDLMDLKQAGRLLDRCYTAVIWWTKRLPVGQWHTIGRDRRLLLTSVDVDLIRAAIAAARPSYSDPEVRLKLAKKQGTRAKLAADVAAKNGKRRGRRPIPEAKRQQILELTVQGLGRNEIARRVGVCRQTVTNVRRASTA